MGQEESSANQPKIIQVKESQPVRENIAAEYEGIPPIEPLIKRQLMMEQFPDDICLPSGQLPHAHKLVKNYFHQISYHLNKNEEAIALQIKRQLQDYIALAPLLEKRRTDLDGRLAKMLAMFRSLDEDVKRTTESLNSAIAKADEIAKSLDPALPSFATYCKPK